MLIYFWNNDWYEVTLIYFEANNNMKIGEVVK